MFSPGTVFCSAHRRMSTGHPAHVTDGLRFRYARNRRPAAGQTAGSLARTRFPSDRHSPGQSSTTQAKKCASTPASSARSPRRIASPGPWNWTAGSLAACQARHHSRPNCSVGAASGAAWVARWEAWRSAQLPKQPPRRAQVRRNPPPTRRQAAAGVAAGAGAASQLAAVTVAGAAGAASRRAAVTVAGAPEQAGLATAKQVGRAAQRPEAFQRWWAQRPPLPSGPSARSGNPGWTAHRHRAALAAYAATASYSQDYPDGVAMAMAAMAERAERARRDATQP